jgi:hypothetical protein
MYVCMFNPLRIHVCSSHTIHGVVYFTNTREIGSHTIYRSGIHAVLDNKIGLLII